MARRVSHWGRYPFPRRSIEQTWGTGITVPGYGFLPNNELTDFNFTPTFNAATGNPGANGRHWMGSHSSCCNRFRWLRACRPAIRRSARCRV